MKERQSKDYRWNKGTEARVINETRMINEGLQMKQIWNKDYIDVTKNKEAKKINKQKDEKIKISNKTVRKVTRLISLSEKVNETKIKARIINETVIIKQR